MSESDAPAVGDMELWSTSEMTSEDAAIADDITGWRAFVNSDRRSEFKETITSRCKGDCIFKCIFDKIDDDQNGLVTMPEYLLFLIHDLKLGTVEVKRGRAKWMEIDVKGRGKIGSDEFGKLLTECLNSAQEVRAAHLGLQLEQALKCYVEQQNLAHKRRNTDACPTRASQKGTNLMEHQSMIVGLLSKFLCPDATSVLEFWFPSNLQDAMSLWFGKSPSLDAEIKERFGGLVEKARKGDLDFWSRDPVECLALVVLLDQFPRNIYRHDKTMYASDLKAQAVCTKALYYNYHRYVTPLQAIFIPCLLLTHSEQIHHQELCVDIWKHYIQNSLCPEDPLRIFEMIFQQHLKVVAKYGRFPHRNEIYGRESTAEEETFLNDPAFRFDLPLHYTDDGKVVFESTKAFESAKDKQGQEDTTCKEEPDAQTY